MFKKKIRQFVDLFFRTLKTPRMIWGYRNNDGKFLDKVRISDTVFFYHKEKIDFSNNVFVWHYTILDGTGEITIGEGCQIGAWVGIFTHSSHIAIRTYGNEYSNVPENEKKYYFIKKVCIGKFVFIGAGSKILPGVTIGDFSLIAAGTILSKTVPAYSLVSGNPGKVIGDVRDMDKKAIDLFPELKNSYVGGF